MKATLTRKTDLEILIESRDKNAINALIEQKEIALEEAINNAEWYASIGLDEMARKTNKRYKKVESSNISLNSRVKALHNTIHDNEHNTN